MRKKLCCLLAVCLLVGLTACKRKDSAHVLNETGDRSEETAEDMEEETKDYTEGVIRSSGIIVCDENVFWGYGTMLHSAFLDQQGRLSDFTSESDLSTEILSLAIKDDLMYAATKEGIFELPLEKRRQGQRAASLVNDHEVSYDSFQIYDDYLYFIYGTTLYRVPEHGGDEEKLEQEVSEFQVTSEGAYCLNSDGHLILLSLDGVERKKLQELDSEGDLIFYKDKAYITTGDADDYIYEYDAPSNEIKKLSFENTLSPYHPVWVTEKSIYYETEHYEVYRYDKESGAESLTDVEYDLSEYYEGCLENDILYYVLSDYLY